MGVEDFKIMIHSPLPQREATAHPLRESGASLSEESFLGETRILVTGGSFVFEVEVCPSNGGSQITFAMALCHPESALNLFAQMIARQGAALGPGVVSIMEDMPPGTEGDFPPAPIESLVSAIEASLAIRRREWRLEFGTEEAAITCKDALRRFIIRKNQPGQ